IYQYITNLIIETIKEVGHLPWQRSWEKTSFSKGKQAINFESKKPYRGINYFLLNFEVKVKDNKSYLVRRKLENPYFLTFNQIKKHKEKLEKGSKGNRDVYFIEMYHHKEILKSRKLLEFSTYNKKKFIEWILKNKSNLKRFKGMNKEEIEQSSLPIIPILKYYNVFNGSDITGIDWGDFP